MYAFLRDLLFPMRCVHCGRWGDLVCDRCESEVEFLENQFCPGCGESSVLGYANHGCRKRTYLDQLTSICWYRGVVRSVITTYKYGNSVRGLENWIRRMITESIEPDLFPRCSIVVPVPLHISRFRQRGFNQSEFIAKVLASYSGFEISTAIITRHKKTSPQSRIGSVVDRKGNVKDAFQITASLNESWSPIHIVLVDDVVTSGNTMQSCARSIKKLSPGVKVSGFTFARG